MDRLSAVDGPQISNNGSAPNSGELRGGVLVGNGRSFSSFASGAAISDNTGDGIMVGSEVGGNGTLRLSGAMVSGNSGHGIVASTGSVVGLSGSSVTANGVNRIRLIKASMAGFPDAPAAPPFNLLANTISGNGESGISCDKTSQVFGDLTGISGAMTCRK
jgi:hypothetical protein